MTWTRRTAGGLFLTLAILGFLLALQLRVQANGHSLDNKSTDELTRLVATLNHENERLLDEMTELRVAALNDQYQGESDLSRLSEQARTVEVLWLVTGLQPAYGRGIRLVISDERGVLEPADLEQLVNELKASGAEAVMVNGRRLEARSSLGQEDDGIVLSGERLVSPYVVQAVGPPSDLESAMEMAGGVVPALQTRSGVSVEIEEQSRIEVPTVTREPVFRLATKAEE